MENLPVNKKTPSHDKDKKPAPKADVPTVFTPEPPQVMNPSVLPEKQEGKRKPTVKDKKRKR